VNVTNESARREQWQFQQAANAQRVGKRDAGGSRVSVRDGEVLIPYQRPPRRNVPCAVCSTTGAPATTPSCKTRQYRGVSVREATTQHKTAQRTTEVALYLDGAASRRRHARQARPAGWRESKPVEARGTAKANAQQNANTLHVAGDGAGFAPVTPQYIFSN